MISTSRLGNVVEEGVGYQESISRFDSVRKEAQQMLNNDTVMANQEVNLLMKFQLLNTLIVGYADLRKKLENFVDSNHGFNAKLDKEHEEAKIALQNYKVHDLNLEQQIREALKEKDEISKNLISKIAQRKEFAKQIEPFNLCKIFNEAKFKVENIEDPANDIFVWILRIFYKEQKSEYYWKNFKVSLFEEGASFEKRQSTRP